MTSLGLEGEIEHTWKDGRREKESDFPNANRSYEGPDKRGWGINVREPERHRLFVRGQKGECVYCARLVVYSIVASVVTAEVYIYQIVRHTLSIDNKDPNPLIARVMFEFQDHALILL